MENTTNNPSNTIEFINTLISDTSNKGEISDGVMTFSQLHSERIALYIAFHRMMTKIHSLKEISESNNESTKISWYSYKNSSGLKAPEGFLYAGLEMSENTVGVLMPEQILQEIKSASSELDKAPSYKPLEKALNLI